MKEIVHYTNSCFFFSLPEDMAFLRSLTKLYVYKNFIEELPEVIIILSCFYNFV